MPLKRQLDDPVASLFGKRGPNVPRRDEPPIDVYQLQFMQFVTSLSSADPRADPPADPNWYKRMLVQNGIPPCAPFMKDKQCSDRYLL